MTANSNNNRPSSNIITNLQALAYALAMTSIIYKVLEATLALTTGNKIRKSNLEQIPSFNSFTHSMLPSQTVFQDLGRQGL